MIRHCKVNLSRGNVKDPADYVDAWFHCWSQEAHVVDASPLMGGHPGGQISALYALVEVPGGNCILVRPDRVRFTDAPRC